KVIANPYGYTFVFTGPIDVETLKQLTSKYISTLKGSKGKKQKQIWKEPSLQTGEVSLRYLAPGMLSTKASVNRIYHGKAQYTTKNSLLSKFITYMLRDRYMKSIREEKGGTYYVGVTSELIKQPTPVISYSIDFDTDPALVDELLEIVQLEIDDFVKNGPKESEINAINLYLQKVYQSRETSVDWLSIITNTLQQQENITLAEEDYLNKITAKEIHDLAKSIFTNGNRMTFVFEPEKE
ncbi:MAG: insulinase family protein, partial [Bacteroidales bacterium]